MQDFRTKWLFACIGIICFFLAAEAAKQYFEYFEQKITAEKVANSKEVESFYQLLAEHKVQSMKWSINSGDRTMKKYYPFTLNEHDSLAAWQEKALSDYKIFIRAMQDTLDSRGEFDFLRGFEYGLKKGQTGGV